MELKDWLNSINLTKKNLMDEDPSVEKDFPPYVVNRCLSGHLDTVMYSNEMNMYSFLPCLLYTSPSPRDATLSRMPSSA